MSNIYGTSGDDNPLNGTSGADTVYGYDGDDWLYGEDGDDTLYGGNGTDTAAYSAYLNNSIIWMDISGYYHIRDTAGSLGTDDLYNVEEVYFTDTGSFTLASLGLTAGGEGFGYSAVVTGTSSGETLNGTAAYDYIEGEGGNDTLNGYQNQDYLFGGDGNDTLNGGDGGDQLFGNDDNDNLYGEDGTDNLYGGAGDDVLDGGDGGDCAIYTSSLYAYYVVYRALDGYVYVQDTAGTDGTDKLIDIENVMSGVYGGPTLDIDALGLVAGGEGWGYSAPVYGTSANETFYGTPGMDQIDAGDGNNVVYGGPGNDNITGGSGNDTLYGGDGNDALTGYTGNNMLYGGNGNDAASGSGGDNMFYGGDGDDYFYIEGGSGNNFMQGGEGDDVFDDRGTGVDTVSYSADPDGVTVDLLTGTATDGWGDTDTLFSYYSVAIIKDVIGSDYADTITLGNADYSSAEGLGGDDTLIGGTGGDYLDGGTGADTMDGGEGYNYYWVDNTGDVIIPGSDTDQVYSSVTFTGADGVDGIQLTGSDDIDATGSTSTGVSLVGNSGDNVLTAGDGRDLLQGGDGVDTLTGGADGDDFVFEGANCFNNIDIITDYTPGSGGDLLDIFVWSFTFNPLVDTLSDFVSIATSGSGSILSADKDGAGTTYIMQQIALLEGVTGITNVNTLYANNNLAIG